MLYNGFKMFVGRLLIISVLLYNTEATFYDEYNGVKIDGSKSKDIITIPVEDKTRTNLTDPDDWYPDYESSTVEDKKPAPGNATPNWWSYGSDAEKKNKTWNYESGYEKENNSTEIVWLYNRFNETVTTTKRPYYSNRYDELENDKNTTGTLYYWHHQAVEASRRPYESNRYNGRWTEGDKKPTIRRKYYVSSYDRWRNRPRNLTIRGPYGYNVGTNDTGYYTNSTTKHYGYWYHQGWNIKTTTSAPYGYNVGTNDTRHYATSTTKHYGSRYDQWWNRITTTDKNYNRVASVSPIDNRTNSSDWNVTTDLVNTKTSTSDHKPVNILIKSSFNANQSKINEPFTDFLKRISGYILPSSKYVAPNSNVTNLAVADGNGNSFFYAYNLVVG